MIRSAALHPITRLIMLMLITVAAAAGCSAEGKRQAAAVAANDVSSGYAADGDRGTLPLPRLSEPEETDAEPYYADRILEWRKSGASDADAAIPVNALKPPAQSAEANAREGSYDGRAEVLKWEGEDGSWIEYRLDVPESGLYEIHMDYHPLTGTGKTGPILLDIALDGKHPFREASAIALYRSWTDERPVKRNELGEEIRPRSVDISSWQTAPFTDSSAAYAKPLLWYFEKGSHKLRLQGDEPVVISSLALVPPQAIPAYDEAAASYPGKPAKSPDAKAAVVTLEAEQYTSKNDPAIQMVYDTDQRTVPVSHGKVLFNSLGGERWNQPNQKVTWTFDAPEDGLYKIALRTLQNRFSQKASYRRIEVDGSVPFAEFLAYRFAYSGSWKGSVLAKEDGEPYLLYLRKGTHTLSLANNYSAVSPIVRGIEDITALLRNVQDDLLSLTGGQEDNNRTWRIRQELSDLPERLSQAAERLELLSHLMMEANGRKDSISQGLGTSAADLRTMLKKEDDIPRHLDDFTSIQERISGYMVSLYQQPLLLDELYIAPAAQPFPDMTASLLEKTAGVLKNFYYSFDNKDSIGKLDDQVLNVWVQRGRDHVTELQDLADELFTPETGIRVKVNLLPNPELLVLSNAAGLQPDIALGLSQDLPVDYAVRGSLHDLSKFPDFKEMYDKYSPGSWLSVYYNKGYYAVPETQSFQVLYYRKDILRNLGLQVPGTWEELYDMLPTLQENYKNFYYNWQQFIPFFNQHGAEFYSPDGLRTSIDSPEGFAAFKQWTDLFNTYAVDKEVPSFYEHFRDGSMPIGISDYNMYLQLSAAAPELNGRWGIALIPGEKEQDGSIARWAGGDQSTGVIFEGSKHKEEAWTFLKWWLSTDTQVRYGSDLESMNGVAFRWNTANIDAFVQLPWRKEDADIILQAWAWYKEKPNLPGGYLLGREIRNAWVRTAIDGMNYRTSMETAVLDVDRELRRKQEEFGFVDQEGTILKHMDVPVVEEPWKGVERYVK